MAGHLAVIVIHGLGEQVPMETLSGFVDSVWSKDLSLVEEGKPHPDTGSDKRTSNASWYKPDRRTRNFDLRLITTESYETASKDRKRADFFEFYWAHRVVGTRWDQVRAWLFGLMLRNPCSNVPPPLRLAWGVMWGLLALYAVGIYFLPKLLAEWPLVLAAATLAAAAGARWIVTALNDRVGDIVRYVDPSPRNIMARQEIREDGVHLLETLLGIEPDGRLTDSQYDRVVVVGHSLGTIVGYDILNHAFGRLNLLFDHDKLAANEQTALHALEQLVRDSWMAGKPLSPDDYLELQNAAREELVEAGHPWIVSDFISIGSPLAHAEFLMARDRKHLADLQAARVYPTCPPQLEYHRREPHYHFSYSASKALGSENAALVDKRVPHHAAVFAYTRWTNIFSPLKRIAGGDIVSGPLSNVFGLLTSKPKDFGEPLASALTGDAEGRDGASETPTPERGAAMISGIKDIAVLPSFTGTHEDTRERRFTHLKYWDTSVANGESGEVPFHIQALRDALDLKEK